MSQREPGSLPAPPERDAELESLATGVELTIASVLQGIPLAIVVPRVGELFGEGELARLFYVPASLLIVFVVWVAFIVHAISFVTWPFDPIHNLLYFVVAGAESLVLYFLTQPALWFLSLSGFALTLGASYIYNQRLLERQRPLYATPARGRLYEHMAADHRASLWFMAGYALVGIAGASLLWLLSWLGLPQGLVWLLLGLAAAVLPALHVRWQIGMVAERSRLIELSRREP